jgi:hypothetical protein
VIVVRAGLVAGPVALAFFSGGYFSPARLVALIVAWVLVALAAVLAPNPLPRLGAVRLTLVAFGLFTAWVALSSGWAPLTGPARSEAQIALLYVATVLASSAVFFTRASVRVLEPLTALGMFVVIGYGLANRFFPGFVIEQHTHSSGGRLEQPLTYWNGIGLLAVLGLLLASRVLGDRSRPRWMRIAAAAAAGPFGMAVYLSFSRGALAALAAGTVALLLLAPNWSQLRASAIALEMAALGAFAGGVFPAVRALAVKGGAAEHQGLAAFAVTVAVMGLGALLARWNARVEDEDRIRVDAFGLGRGARLAGVALILAIAVVPIAVAAASSNEQAAFGATSNRFSNSGTNRYKYWRVAVDTFADHPIAGIGAGGWVVDWQKHRTINENVLQPHSLWLQTLAELGIVGLGLLLLAVAGLALAARTAHGHDPTTTAGAITVLIAWAFHASFDWDWQMPATTLAAMVFAGAILALAGRTRAEDAADPVPAGA